jgi:hypothetical protein
MIGFYIAVEFMVLWLATVQGEIQGFLYRPEVLLSLDSVLVSTEATRAGFLTNKDFDFVSVQLGAKEWGALSLYLRLGLRGLGLRPLALWLGLRSVSSRFGLWSLASRLFGLSFRDSVFGLSLRGSVPGLVLRASVFCPLVSRLGLLLQVVSNGDSKCASCVRWGVKELHLCYNSCYSFY